MAEKRSIIYEITFKGTEDQQMKLSQLRKTIDDLTKEKAKLIEKDKASHGQNEIVKQKIDKVNQALREEKKNVNAVQREIDSITKANKSAAGSYNELSAKLAIAKSRFKELSAEQRKTGEGRGLQAQIKNINNDLKNLDKQGGVFIRNVGNYFGSLKTAAIGMGAGIVAAFSVGAMVSFFKAGIQHSMEWEAREKKLLFAIDGNNEAQKRLLKTAQQLESTSLFEDEAIVEAQALALNLGRTEAETNKMVETAMGLSRVTGVDLNTAMIQLSGTLEGTKGRLGKYSNELKNMEEADLKAGKGIEVLHKQFSKFATEGIETTEGKIKRYNDSIDDLKRSIGDALLPAVSSAAMAISNMVSGIADYLKVPASEKMQEEKDELNNLIGAITATNTTQSVRNSLLTELQTKYPDYLGNLNKETVTNEQLRNRLVEVNAEYDKKIKSLIASELYAETAKEQSESLKKESELTTELSKANRELTKLLAEQRQERIKTKTATTSQSFSIAELSAKTTDLSAAINDEREKRKKLNDEVRATMQLMQTDLDYKSATVDELKAIIDYNGYKTVAEAKAAGKAKGFALSELKRREEEAKFLKEVIKTEEELAKEKEKAQKAAEEAWQKELKAFEQRQTLAKSEFELLTKTEQEKTDFEAKQLIQRANFLKQHGKISNEEYLTTYNQALKLKIDFNTKLLEEDKKYQDEVDIGFEERRKQREEEQFNADQIAIQNQITLDKQLKAAKEKSRQEELQNQSDVFSATSGLFKAFGNKQKGFVLSSIALDTAASISAATASSTKNPLNSVTFGAAGIAQFISMLAQIMGNIMQAKEVLSQAKFASGGVADGGLFKGRSHSDGGIPIEVEGGESIINKRSTKMFAPILSAINQIGGGRAFADGGFVQRAITSPVIESVNNINEMRRMFELMPTPIVTVEDINAGINSRNKIITRATK